MTVTEGPPLTEISYAQARSWCVDKRSGCLSSSPRLLHKNSALGVEVVGGVCTRTVMRKYIPWGRFQLSSRIASRPDTCDVYTSIKLSKSIKETVPITVSQSNGRVQRCIKNVCTTRQQHHFYGKYRILGGF